MTSLWARWVILSNVRTDLNLTEFHFWSNFHVNWGKQWPDMTSYGLDEWFWAMFEPTWTWPNFTFGQLFMWIGANNDQIWHPYGLDEWFWAMFEPTWTWPNFTLGQLFMWIGANNDQIWLPIYGLDEWFWAMFEPTWTWPNFTFGQLFMWIGGK